MPPMPLEAAPGDYPKRWPKCSVEVKCKACGHEGLTETAIENGSAVWLVFFVMLITGLYCCSPAAFCIDSIKDVKHSCSKCKRVLGVFNHF